MPRKVSHFRRIEGRERIALAKVRVGTIIEVIDYLINSKNLYINHELLLPIEACLITKENIENLDQIRELISKPEAINQCNEWISKNLRKDIVITGSPSTAEAVESLNNLSVALPLLDQKELLSSTKST